MYDTCTFWYGCMMNFLRTCRIICRIRVWRCLVLLGIFIQVWYIWYECLMNFLWSCHIICSHAVEKNVSESWQLVVDCKDHWRRESCKLETRQKDCPFPVFCLYIQISLSSHSRFLRSASISNNFHGFAIAIRHNWMC